MKDTYLLVRSVVAKLPLGYVPDAASLSTKLVVSADAAERRVQLVAAVGVLVSSQLWKNPTNNLSADVVMFWLVRFVVAGDTSALSEAELEALSDTGEDVAMPDHVPTRILRNVAAEE
jgi:hypothetical protein